MKLFVVYGPNAETYRREAHGAELQFHPKRMLVQFKRGEKHTGFVTLTARVRRTSDGKWFESTSDNDSFSLMADKELAKTLEEFVVSKVDYIALS